MSTCASNSLVQFSSVSPFPSTHARAAAFFLPSKPTPSYCCSAPAGGLISTISPISTSPSAGNWRCPDPWMKSKSSRLLLFKQMDHLEVWHLVSEIKSRAWFLTYPKKQRYFWLQSTKIKPHYLFTVIPCLVSIGILVLVRASPFSRGMLNASLILAFSHASILRMPESLLKNRWKSIYKMLVNSACSWCFSPKLTRVLPTREYNGTWGEGSYQPNFQTRGGGKLKEKR